MLTLRFRFVAALGVLLFLIVAGSVSTWIAASRVHAADVNDSKLKVLQKEKLTVAQQVATLANRSYQTGTESFANVLEANQAVGNAQLDLCDTNAERIAVLERMLAQERDFEKHVAARVSAEVAPQSSLLKAKLNRLDVEIALERARDN